MNVSVKTEDNLREAFSGESAAYRRYMMYAEKADEDEYPQAAKLFRAVAMAEAIHARNHFNAIDGIGTTKDNLMAAVLAENEEIAGVYPYFIDDAEKERNARALRTFEWAIKVERVHHGLFQHALDAVKEKKPLEEKTYYVCQVCGNTVEDGAPDKCPVCGATKELFEMVE
jgi:rubrerythrin